jgi:hypothetical protein
MKKLYFLVLLLTVVLIASGCAKSKKEMMDEVSEKGFFHYTADDLGFGLYLPRDFIYYQVQRQQNDNFTDVQFFVPTTDKSAFDPNFEGYTKPVTVRIFNEKYWNSSLNGDEKKDYTKLGEKNKKVYTMLFWEKPSADWSVKWTDEMIKSIVEKVEIK